MASRPSSSSARASQPSAPFALEGLFQRSSRLAGQPVKYSPRGAHASSDSLPPRAGNAKKDNSGAEGLSHSSTLPLDTKRGEVKGPLEGLFRPTSPPRRLFGPTRPQTARDWSEKSRSTMGETDARVSNPPLSAGGWARNSSASGSRQPRSARPPTAPTSSGPMPFHGELSFSLNESAGVGSSGVGVFIGGGPHQPRMGLRGTARQSSGTRLSDGDFHKGVVNALGGVLRQQRSVGSAGVHVHGASHPPATNEFSSTGITSPRPPSGVSVGSSRDRLRAMPTTNQKVVAPTEGLGANISSSSRPPPPPIDQHSGLRSFSPRPLSTSSELEGPKPTPPKAQRPDHTQKSVPEDSLTSGKHSSDAPSSQERDRKERLVAQKRADWAKQRWSSSARERRRTLERELSSHHGGHVPASGESVPSERASPLPFTLSASSLRSFPSGLSSAVEARSVEKRGEKEGHNSTRSAFDVSPVSSAAPVRTDYHQFLQFAWMREVDNEESFQRKTLLATETEKFALLIRVASTVFSRLRARESHVDWLFSTSDGRKDLASEEKSQVSFQDSSLSSLETTMGSSVSGQTLEVSRPTTSISAQLRKEQLDSLMKAREEGNALYRDQNYAAAHAAYSRIVDAARSAGAASPSTSGSISSSGYSNRAAMRELHARALLNRCATGLALLNFDGCVADGLEALRVIGSLGSSSAQNNSEDASGEEGSAPNTSLRAKAWLRVAKSYALTESYTAAEDAYRRAVEACEGTANASAHQTTAAGLGELKRVAESEASAIPTLQKMREAFSKRQYRECLSIARGEDEKNRSSFGNGTKSAGTTAIYKAVEAFVREAPITLLLLEAEAHTRPLSARVEGAKYVTALLAVAEKCDLKLPPGTNGHTAEGGYCGTSTQPLFSTNSLILSNFTQHICDALVCVGRAAFFSGPLFGKVAAQRINMCLSLRHDHKAALILRSEINGFERLSSEAAAFVEKGKPTAAIEKLTLLIEMARSLGSGPLVASAALARADVFSSRLNNTPSAISDTSMAIEAEPQNPRAHAARARLFQGIGDYKRALKDMSTAASLSDELHAEKEQRSQQQQQQSGSDGSCDFVNPYKDDLDELIRQCREDSDPLGAFGFEFREEARRTRSAASDTRRSHRSNHHRSHRGSSGRGNDESAFSGTVGVRSAHVVLGVASSSSVSEIRQAYRRLVLTCHPDKFVSASESLRKEKEKMFKEISKAYAELTDGLARGGEGSGP